MSGTIALARVEHIERIGVIGYDKVPAQLADGAFVLKYQMNSTRFAISPGSRISQMSSSARMISPTERFCWWQ